VEVKICDPETGDEKKDCETGEILVRGYNVMRGYYNDPEGTALAIDQQGWLHTGDLAYRRPDGNICFMSRLKDIIIKNGENISPGEIESVIMEHDAVLDAKVVGVLEHSGDDAIFAFVIIKTDQHITEDELRLFCQKRLYKLKIPKEFFFINNFPASSTGKVIKRDLVIYAKDVLSKKLQSGCEYLSW
jgi:fatty-acyl-CoA synthase